MGWPFLGETNEFLKQGPEFMKNKGARYGNVFKSHILGSPTIISMDPELNRYILLNEAKGLVPGYPKSMLDILGERNIAAVYGATHKHLRNNMLSLVGTSLVKDRLFSRIDKYMKLYLSNWDSKIIDLQEKTMDVKMESMSNPNSRIRLGSSYCSCGFRVRIYTSWTKENPGRRFARCQCLTDERCDYFEWIDPIMCDRSRVIIPGLLSRVNRTEAENARVMREFDEMSTQMQVLVNSLHNLEAENMALRRKQKLAMICAMIVFLWADVSFPLVEMPSSLMNLNTILGHCLFPKCDALVC
ncbi:hypothetical protein RD792_011255 [Penstemon davidsonii]|uniref:GRF-type domain-containing protein n=1 Tax=Penstemon davidsonii TaxID=160366 RepID=A0ABR0D4B1_9LAMI|nr:hypothetical protein RD792_011255 [Penstemon davidsonii]